MKLTKTLSIVPMLAAFAISTALLKPAIDVDAAASTQKATRTPRPTQTRRPTSTPRPTRTPKPTVTPRPTKTPRPTLTPTGTPDPNAAFKSFDALCDSVKRLTDSQKSAFSKSNEGKRIGPWRGRVLSSGRDYAIFIMNTPKFQTGGLSTPLRLAFVGHPNKRFEAGLVYDFYGEFVKISGVGGKGACNAILWTNLDESKSQQVEDPVK
jgi:hypothetical protein